MQNLTSKSGSFTVDEEGTLTAFTPASGNIAVPDSNVPERPDRVCSLCHLEIPEGVKKIPDGFFSHYYIGFLKFPRSLTTLGAMSFAFCDIGSFTVTSNCSSIARGAFFCTSFFVRVNFPGTVLPQRHYRFFKRMYLKTVGNLEVTEKDYSDQPTEHIPIKILRNESGSFYLDDYGILYEFLPAENNCISKYGENPVVLRNLIIPEGVVIISGSLFQRHTVLERFVLPESLRMIGTNDGCAFSDCNLPDVVIPGKLGEVRMSDAAFIGSSFKSLCLPNGFRTTRRDFKDCKIEKLLLRVKSEQEELVCFLDAMLPDQIAVIED